MIYFKVMLNLLYEILDLMHEFPNLFYESPLPEIISKMIAWFI